MMAELDELDRFFRIFAGIEEAVRRLFADEKQGT